MNKLLLGLAFGAMVLVAGLNNAIAAEESPKDVVKNTIENIISVLEERTDKDAINDADREGIRKVVAGKFDYFEMSRRSVGPEFDALSASKKVEFADVFRQMLEYSYGNQLAGYNGQKVAFEDAEFKSDKARVKGAVIDANKSIPMEYRLHQTASGWQVYDIKIEGVSMISTFRQDFKSIVNDSGIAGLLTVLQAKVEKLKSNG
ncbi:MAG: hypothetical protein AUK35_04335 [Zetaproteobacteria bacterium CG2_30_46_52]|nr:MAG: hypothetical protein AUK35_04335 [Zetaproteobacteria bacterium CG2_30_46_52]